MSPLLETSHDIHRPEPLQVKGSSKARTLSIRASNTAVISIEELQALREAISAPPTPLLESARQVKDAQELEPSGTPLPSRGDIVEFTPIDSPTELLAEPAVLTNPHRIIEEPIVETVDVDAQESEPSESAETPPPFQADIVEFIPIDSPIEPLVELEAVVLTKSHHVIEGSLVETVEHVEMPSHPLIELPDSQVDVSEEAATSEALSPIVHLESVSIQKLAQPRQPVVIDLPIAVGDVQSSPEPPATPPRRAQPELIKPLSPLDATPPPHVDSPVAIAPADVVHEESPSVTETSADPPATPQLSPSQWARLPPRPVSMIVESPTRSTGPARSPFLIPSAPEHPRFPIRSPEETEFGTISFHRTTLSLPRSDNFTSHFTEPGLNQKASTFSAVVHRKVTELPANLGHIPMSPQLARTRKPVRDSADLASLLANAALLEQKLMEGELPSETSYEVQASSSGNALESAVLVDHSERWKPVEHIKPSEKPRRKPSFRNPLGRNKSAKDPASMPQVDDNFFDRRVRTRSSTSQTSFHTRVVSAYHPPPPPPSETHTRAHSQGSQLTVKTTETSSAPPTPPPKSPPAKYLSGLRRLTGAYPRNSVSTSSEISSEDSMLVVTPPNYSPDLIANSTRQPPEAGRATTPSRTGIAWPSLSAKKSFGNLSKAKSFLSRKRSKSNSSVASAADMAGKRTITCWR